MSKIIIETCSTKICTVIVSLRLYVFALPYVANAFELDNLKTLLTVYPSVNVTGSQKPFLNNDIHSKTANLLAQYYLSHILKKAKAQQ